MQTLNLKASILGLVLAQREIRIAQEEIGIVEILLLFERLRKRLLPQGEIVRAMLLLRAVGCVS